MLLVVRGTALYITDGFPQRTWNAEGSRLAEMLVGDFYIGDFRVYMSLFWFIARGDRPRLRPDPDQVRQLDPGLRRERQLGAGARRAVERDQDRAVHADRGRWRRSPGIISSIRTSAANPNSGTGYELEVIAMVVIGGTALTGGRGTIIGTVLGVFILRVMRNGIVLIGVPGLAYNIFIGAIILG